MQERMTPAERQRLRAWAQRAANAYWAMPAEDRAFLERAVAAMPPGQSRLPPGRARRMMDQVRAAGASVGRKAVERHE